MYGSFHSFYYLMPTCFFWCLLLSVVLFEIIATSIFFTFRKKSDASKIPALKALTKKNVTKSPNLAKKRQTSPDNVASSTTKPSLTTLSVTAPSDEMVHRSTEDLESVSVVRLEKLI